MSSSFHPKGNSLFYREGNQALQGKSWPEVLEALGVIWGMRGHSPGPGSHPGSRGAPGPHQPCWQGRALSGAGAMSHALLELGVRAETCNSSGSVDPALIKRKKEG